MESQYTHASPIQANLKASTITLLIETVRIQGRAMVRNKPLIRGHVMYLLQNAKYTKHDVAATMNATLCTLHTPGA